ncbi:DMT family transporter [Thiotrichales bacterium 19S3-7]|nr:DMT family transporter [Thiotrichales bacterium 19S3-7]MCF6801768.1 DMT family transporter [Thiotrichales bacterium 19S3-11]
MRLGIILGIVSGFLWGLNDVLTNLFSLHVDLDILKSVVVFSLGLAFLQDAGSSVGILSYYLVKREVISEIKKMKRATIVIVIAALCAGPLGMVAGILGISYAGPVYAGVITSCYPIVALILSVFLIRERITNLKVIGIILSVFAVVMISVSGAESDANYIALGMTFAAIAMFGWGMESVLFAWVHLKTNLKPMWLLAIRQFASAVSYLIILMGLLFLWHNQLVETFKQMHWPLLIISCIISASFSYILYYHTIKRIGAALGTTFNASFVFWAAIFSQLLGLSHLSISFWFWAVILIAGIYCAVSYRVPKIRLRG